MTIGLLFISIPVVVLISQGDRRAEWPDWAWALLFGLGVLGFVFGSVVLLGSKKTTEKWAQLADNPAHVSGIKTPLYSTKRFLLVK